MLNSLSTYMIFFIGHITPLLIFQRVCGINSQYFKEVIYYDYKPSKKYEGSREDEYEWINLNPVAEFLKPVVRKDPA